MQATRGILTAPLWRSNPLLTRGIGLSPVLVVSDSLLSGLVMGVVVVLLLVGAGTVMGSLRAWIPPQLRIPCHALVLATLATVIDQALAAWSYPLHQALGVYPQVAAASALVYARLEDCAMQAPLPVVVGDAVANGAGCLWVAATLGAVREWLASGAVGHGLWLPAAGGAHGGVALAALPAGAFVLLAGLQALRRHVGPEPAAEAAH